MIENNLFWYCCFLPRYSFSFFWERKKFEKERERRRKKTRFVWVRSEHSCFRIFLLFYDGWLSVTTGQSKHYYTQQGRKHVNEESGGHKNTRE